MPPARRRSAPSAFSVVVSRRPSCESPVAPKFIQARLRFWPVSNARCSRG